MKGISLSVVIAGGGTGGHLSPGIAIAQEFSERDVTNRILFIGTNRPLEVAMLSRAGFAHRSITAEGFKSRGKLQQIAAMIKVPKGLFEALEILSAVKADIVVGVGSFAAGPVVLGAKLMGIKTVLHEQNLLPGMTNRLLAPLADRVYVSFEKTKTFFKSSKVMVTGNPVRSEFQETLYGTDQTTSSLMKKDGLFTIMITGGSQGAHGLNEMIMDGLQYISQKNSLFFIHQSGLEDEDRVRDAYQKNSISCLVQPFFPDIASQYRKADLVICRAGATTIAEVTALGKGVLFIPFPFSADQHQVKNAELLKDADAADMMFEDAANGKSLMDRIEYYASHPEILERMARKAGELGRIDAARTIVDDCYRLLQKN